MTRDDLSLSRTLEALLAHAHCLAGATHTEAVAAVLADVRALDGVRDRRERFAQALERARRIVSGGRKTAKRRTA